MSEETTMNYVQLVEGTEHFGNIEQIITYAGYIGKVSPCTIEGLIKRLQNTNKFGYDLIQGKEIERLKEEAKTNALKIAAYDRHINEIEELKAIIEESDKSLSEHIIEEYHLNQELKELQEKWNKVVEEVENLIIDNQKSRNIADEGSRIQLIHAANINTLLRIISILKPTPQTDK